MSSHRHNAATAFQAMHGILVFIKHHTLFIRNDQSLLMLYNNVNVAFHPALLLPCNPTVPFGAGGLGNGGVGVGVGASVYGRGPGVGVGQVGAVGSTGVTQTGVNTGSSITGGFNQGIAGLQLPGVTSLPATNINRDITPRGVSSDAGASAVARSSKWLWLIFVRIEDTRSLSPCSWCESTRLHKRVEIVQKQSSNISFHRQLMVLMWLPETYLLSKVTDWVIKYMFILHTHVSAMENEWNSVHELQESNVQHSKHPTTASCCIP